MQKMYFYEPKNGHGLRHDPFKAIIGPRPIAWVSTRNPNGVLNLAPYSFFNAVNGAPPIIAFSSVGHKDTLKNIESTGEFVWNLVSKPLVEQMNITASPVPFGVDEFALAGLTPDESKVVKAPRVSESFVSFECLLTQILQLTALNGEPLETWCIFGQVVGVHINQSLLKDRIYYCADANPVLRGGGPSEYFEISASSAFHLARPE